MQPSAVPSPAPLPRLGAQPCCSWEPQSSLKCILFLTQKVPVSAVTAPNTPSVTSVSPQCHPSRPALGWSPCVHHRLPVLAQPLPPREHPTLCLASTSSWGCPGSCARHGERGQGLRGSQLPLPIAAQPGCSFLGQRVLWQAGGQQGPWPEQLPLM